MNAPEIRSIFNTRRGRTILLVVAAACILLIIAIAGWTISSDLYAPDYYAKSLPPSLMHLFGTDYQGRDTFFRTVKGLSTSILIGTFASVISSLIGCIIGILAATMSGAFDRFIQWLINVCMGVPGLVMLMLISYACGKGARGIIIGVAVTHWTDLARLIRAEVLEAKNKQYVLAAEKMGRSKWQIAKDHILPYIFPQLLIGTILMFPHAILHEAGITFLGFGLSLDSPAIGVILSEAMQQLALGMWWTVLFPGVSLFMIVLLFDKIGENVRLLLDPHHTQE